MMQATSLTSGVLLLWKTLEAYGYDSNDVFTQAGLEPAKLSDPDARYRDENVLKVWEYIINNINDPCIGLKTAEFFHPTTLHALGFAWLSSESLEAAFYRVVRYSKILTDHETFNFTETEKDFEFSIQVNKSGTIFPDEDYDLALAITVKLCRLSLGKTYSPISIEFQRPVPACIEEFNHYFKTDLEFNRPAYVLHLDKADVKKQLVTANSELIHLNEQVMLDYLERKQRNDIVMRVRKKIIEHLPSGGITQNRVSKSLHMSERNLQRKLKEHGESYKKMLEETREELASLYLDDKKYSINEITYLLGFSEPSNFTRAFKRWNGISPSQYRQQ
jgi:AraC-like DNA-binding protein